MKRLFSPPWSGSCVSHHFRESSIQMYPRWKSHSSLYAYSTSAALLIHPKWICLEIVSSPRSICTLHQLPLKKKKKKKVMVKRVCVISLFCLYASDSLGPRLYVFQFSICLSHSRECDISGIFFKFGTHVYLYSCMNYSEVCGQRLAVTVTKLVTTNWADCFDPLCFLAEEDN